MLEAMFSGRHEVVREADGSVFIDRDGVLFEHVLAFLRNGSNWRPPATVDAKTLFNEAAFFALQPMMDVLRPRTEPVSLTNCERIGSALCLKNRNRDGTALFRPTNPDDFSFTIQLLADEELVWLGLRHVGSETAGWKFMTDRLGLQLYAPTADRCKFDRPLAFDPEDSFETVEARRTRDLIKAGSTFGLHFVRGTPPRLSFSFNGKPMDETRTLLRPGDDDFHRESGLVAPYGPPVPVTGPGSLSCGKDDLLWPGEGYFLVEVTICSREWVPDEQDEAEFELAMDDDDDDTFVSGIYRGVELCNRRVSSGVVAIVD